MALPQNPIQEKDFSLRSFFSFGISPRRQFRRIVAFSFVVALILVSLHLYFFYRVETHTLFVRDTTPAPVLPNVDASKLNTVLNIYDARAVSRVGALNKVPLVLDPGK